MDGRFTARTAGQRKSLPPTNAQNGPLIVTEKYTVSG